jgi:hypothetical protein
LAHGANSNARAGARQIERGFCFRLDLTDGIPARRRLPSADKVAFRNEFV